MRFYRDGGGNRFVTIEVGPAPYFAPQVGFPGANSIFVPLGPRPAAAQDLARQIVKSLL